MTYGSSHSHGSRLAVLSSVGVVVVGCGSDPSWLQTVPMASCALLSYMSPAVSLALDVQDKEPGEHGGPAWRAGGPVRWVQRLAGRILPE